MGEKVAEMTLRIKVYQKDQILSQEKFHKVIRRYLAAAGDLGFELRANKPGFGYDGEFSTIDGDISWETKMSAKTKETV